MPLNQKPDLPALPYAAFGPELENIIETVANLTSREAPLRATNAPRAELLVEAVARITGNTYRTVKYLCSETQNVGKRPEYVLSVPPLARSLVDAVCLCVYLFEDIPSRSAQYFRGGWRELAEELERYKQAFGTDPAWEEWLGEYQKGLDGMRVEAGVSEEEAANPKKLPYWPTPGQMLKDGSLTAESKAF